MQIIPADGDATISMSGTTYEKDAYSAPPPMQLEYSLDYGEEWTEWSDFSSGITVPYNRRILFRGDCPYGTAWEASGLNGYRKFISDGDIEVAGNLYSILGKNRYNTNVLAAGYDDNVYHDIRFSYLFNKAPVVACDSLKLSASGQLSTKCYYSMFLNCSGLQYAVSSLPSEQLAPLCYMSMFMFCSALTAPPSICAQTTEAQACRCMFRKCGQLDHLWVHFRDFSNDNCLLDMLDGTKSGGTLYISNEADEENFTAGYLGYDSWTLEHISM